MEYRQEPWTGYSLAALIALTAMWMSLGSLQHFQNADSIVPVLVSLQHWTPFYWEANRYGMLVPLLAKPFHDPLSNLIVQTGLSVFAGLAASFLLLRYFFQNSRVWIAAAALQNIWLFLLVPKPIQFDWLVGQCYGVSLALGLAGLLLLERRRLLLAILLILLAHWVNFAVFLLLIPLILSRQLMTRNKKTLLLSSSFVALGAIGGFVLMETAQFRTADATLSPFSMWITGWVELARRTWAALVPHPLLLLWVVVPAAVGLTTALLTRTQRKALLLAPSALMVTAMLYWLMAGTLLWVRENAYVTRYVYPSLFLLSAALALLTVAPLEGALNRSRVLALVPASLMFIVAGAIYGRPSAALVRHDIDQRVGSMASEVVGSGAQLITGDYWTVWPAVFIANLDLYENHEQRSVYGLCYRSVETSAFWRDQRKLCVAAPLHDADATRILKGTGRQFRSAKVLNTIEVFCEP